jgi:hypothetical protein
VPAVLKRLRPIERSMIAQLGTCMCIYTTAYKQNFYKGHTITFVLPLERVATELPRLPKDIKVIVE